MNPQKAKEQFLMYAIKHTKLDTYVSMAEFKMELKRFRSIRRAFVAYEKTKTIELPLFITHFVILHNLFPVDVLNKFLFSEVPDKHWKRLKATLSFLNLLVQDNTLKLLTTPVVTVRLNRIVADRKFLKVLENEIANK